MKMLDMLLRPENQNTPLPAASEQDYKLWQMQNMSISDILRGIMSDYDYQGAYLAGLNRNAAAGEHFTDLYKKPNHPTFSNESFNPLGVPSGRWEGDTYIRPDGMTDLSTLR